MKKLLSQANDFYRLMNRRRTIRNFTSQDVSLDVINECIRAAATAPSGAHKQPWHFAVIKSEEMKSTYF